MSTITDRLGLGGEARPLKLGKSFQNFPTNRGGSRETERLHTVRYDFKPASVDTTKMAEIEFGDNNKVTVTMPNVESSGMAQTVFKGSRKPHLKECVLIIDHETGELTLERLTHCVTVKKTRAEGSSRAGLPRPLTPSFETTSEKSQGSSQQQQQQQQQPSERMPATSSQKKLSSPINGSNNISSNNGRPISPKLQLPSSMPSTHQLLLPQNGSPLPGSRSDRSSPNVSYFGSHRSPLIPTPTLNSSSQLQERQSSSNINKSSKPDDDMIGILSESSSDSSDHGSSSNDNSDSSSDEDEEIKQSIKEGLKNIKDEASSKGGSSSSGSDSSSDSEDEPEPMPPVPIVKPSKSLTNGSSMALPSMPNMLSMPKFSQLSEDLQLSESGSDSD